jgi:DNA invertase Pin-like site-specific DNA recombinase
MRVAILTRVSSERQAEEDRLPQTGEIVDWYPR